MVGAGAFEFIARPLAPPRRNGADAVHARGNDVRRPVTDHHRKAGIAAGDLQSGADQRRLVTVARGQFGTVQCAEEPCDAEAHRHSAGRDGRLRGHNLQRVTSPAQTVQSLGAPG